MNTPISLEDAIEALGAITLDDADQLLLRDVSAQTVNTLTIAALKTALGYQPSDADLTAIAALSTTAVGRSLLAAVDATAIRAITESAPLASPTFTGTVVVPAPTAANQPLRTTGVPDAATGFTGLIATSDTGVRNMDSLLLGGFTRDGNTTCSVRRGGHMVEWNIPLLWPSNATNAQTIINVMPPGFGPRIALASQPASPVTGLVRSDVSIFVFDGATDAIAMYYPGSPLAASARAWFTFSYMTTSAWPTTLPGTAA